MIACLVIRGPRTIAARFRSALSRLLVEIVLRITPIDDRRWRGVQQFARWFKSHSS
jgi:hypothetical protein